MELIIKFNIDNAAFNEDTDEIKRVIHTAIDKIDQDGESLMNGYHMPLSDINGNKIGYVAIEEEPTLNPFDIASKKFKENKDPIDIVKTLMDTYNVY